MCLIQIIHIKQIFFTCLHRHTWMSKNQSTLKAFLLFYGFFLSKTVCSILALCPVCQLVTYQGVTSCFFLLSSLSQGPVQITERLIWRWRGANRLFSFLIPVLTKLQYNINHQAYKIRKAISLYYIKNIAVSNISTEHKGFNWFKRHYQKLA